MTALVAIPTYLVMGSMSYALLFQSEATYGTALRHVLSNPRQPFSFP